MAPFNLSDLAVKEIKIPKRQLAPETKKNYTVKFLAAHFIDFWALFWVSMISTTVFEVSARSFMKGSLLTKTWDHTSFSQFQMVSWTMLALGYFFTSYFMNNGQTFGMKVMKVRVSMESHSFRSAFRWAVMSLSLYFTFGLSLRPGQQMLRQHGEICAHDHLWQELMRQKEMAAPDVRTITPEPVEEVFVEAA